MPRKGHIAIYSASHSTFVLTLAVLAQAHLKVMILIYYALFLQLSKWLLYPWQDYLCVSLHDVWAGSQVFPNPHEVCRYRFASHELCAFSNKLV